MVEYNSTKTLKSVHDSIEWFILPIPFNNRLAAYFGITSKKPELGSLPVSDPTLLQAQDRVETYTEPKSVFEHLRLQCLHDWWGRGANFRGQGSPRLLGTRWDELFTRRCTPQGPHRGHPGGQSLFGSAGTAAGTRARTPAGSARSAVRTARNRGRAACRPSTVCVSG